jgi:hypothetical protein
MGSEVIKRPIFQENFYEFMLYDENNKTVNRQLVELGVAERAFQTDQLPLCLSYPSFNMLEKLTVYPSFSERCSMLEYYRVDFNVFEERNISPVTNTFAFEKELAEALNNPCYLKVREAFLKSIWIEGCL